MKKDFILHNFKFVDGLVSAKYSVVTTDDGGLIHDQIFSQKDTRPIHNDLRVLFEQSTGIADLLLSIPSYAIKVEGLSFSWDGDNSTIQIAGTYESNFTSASFKTRKIKYKQLPGPMCQDIADAVTEFAREVEAYFMEGKSAEVAAFGE